MRRLFIIRKDLNLHAGKLAAMVGHCAEGYWMNIIRNDANAEQFFKDGIVTGYKIYIDNDIVTDYINGIFTKTICEAKNLNHLMKVVDIAKELGLHEGTDYGFIDDVCKTDLTPEFTDENGVGRCRVGIWFKPLPDDISHKLSKKYQLYKG
jgi:peptidyl-tRNA hydrolase